MKTVGITGATGFVGSALVAALRARGDQVRAFTRSAGQARELFGADGVEPVEAYLEAAGAWQARIAGCDAVVHLAGEPIAGRRWDARQKQIVRDSRVEAARYIAEAIAAAPKGQRPAVLVTASGVDYYEFADPTFDDDEIDEAQGAGDTFLARVCRDWEEEARSAAAAGVRVVCMRTGVVLGPGGALGRMSGPFRFFVGGRLGSGQQWFSWIHRDDVVAAYLAAIDDPRYSGAVNLVAPEAVRAGDVARTLGDVMHRPAWLPVPGFALKAAVGEVADYLLHGRRVVPRALQRFGFSFRHPRLAEAIQSSLS